MQVNKEYPWSPVAALVVDAWDDAWDDEAVPENTPEVPKTVRVEISGGTEETTWSVDAPSWFLSQFVSALIMFDAGEVYQILIGSSSDDRTEEGVIPGIAIFDKLKQQRKHQDFQSEYGRDYDKDPESDVNASIVDKIKNMDTSIIDKIEHNTVA